MVKGEALLKAKKAKRGLVDSTRHKIAYLKRTNDSKSLLERYEVQLSKDLAKNVIILSIDCLRADHMSIYGYNRNTTPFLESLDDLAVFTDAKAASPWTWSAVASIITGLYPSEHGAKFNCEIRNMDLKDFPSIINEDIITLPEIIQYLGGESYLDAGGIYFAEKVCSGRYKRILNGVGDTAAEQIKRLILFLERNRAENRPSFAHVHIGDMHEPIYTSDKFLNIFEDISFDESLRKWRFREGNVGSGDWKKYKHGKIALYDASLRYIDSVIHQFYKYLEENDLLDDTTVFITADHGEEFWDHVELEKENFYDPRGYYGVGHGHNMFHEITNIPLIAFGHGIKPGTYTNRVSQVDIVPTILQILGIGHQISKFEERGLESDGKRELLCEDSAYGYEKKVRWQNNRKYMISKGDDVAWKFDLDYDHTEQNPISIQQGDPI